MKGIIIIFHFNAYNYQGFERRQEIIRKWGGETLKGRWDRKDKISSIFAFILHILNVFYDKINELRSFPMLLMEMTNEGVN